MQSTTALCQTAQPPLGVDAVPLQSGGESNDDEREYSSSAVLLTFVDAGVQLYVVSKQSAEVKLQASWSSPDTSSAGMSCKAILLRGANGQVEYCAAAVGGDVYIWGLSQPSMTSGSCIRLGQHPVTHLTCWNPNKDAISGVIVTCADGSVHFLEQHVEEGFRRGAALGARGFHVQGVTVVHHGHASKVAVFGVSRKNGSNEMKEEKKKQKATKKKTARGKRKASEPENTIDDVVVEFLSLRKGELEVSRRRVNAAGRNETAASVCVDSKSGCVAVLWGSGEFERFDFPSTESQVMDVQDIKATDGGVLRFSRRLSADVDWTVGSVALLRPGLVSIHSPSGQTSVWDVLYGTPRGTIQVNAAVNQVATELRDEEEDENRKVFVVTDTGVMCYYSPDLFSAPSLSSSLGLMMRNDPNPLPSSSSSSSSRSIALAAMLPFPMTDAEQSFLVEAGLLESEGSITTMIATPANEFLQAIKAFLSGATNVASRPKRRKTTASPYSMQTFCQPVLAHLLGACVRSGWEYLGSVAVLLDAHTVSITSCPDLVPALLALLNGSVEAKKQYVVAASSLLVQALQRIRDLPEQLLVRVLQYALQPHAQADKASSGSALLNRVFSSDANQVALRGALNVLQTSECVALLSYLTDLLAAHLDVGDETKRDDTLPSVQQCLDKVMVLLDSHFADIALRGNKGIQVDVLTRIMDLAQRETSLCEESNKLRACMGELSAASAARAVQGTSSKKADAGIVADYCIEHITLLP